MSKATNAKLDFSGMWWCRNGKKVVVGKCDFHTAEWRGVVLGDAMKIYTYYDGEGNCRMVMGWVGDVKEWDLVRRENPQAGGSV
jgi:hypothetical protein